MPPRGITLGLLAATLLAASCGRVSDATPHRQGRAARHRAGGRQRADCRPRARWRDDGIAARASGPRARRRRRHARLHRGHLRRQASAHRAGLSRRAFRRRPRPAVRVRDRPAQLPAVAAGCRRRPTTSPPRSSPTPSRRPPPPCAAPSTPTPRRCLRRCRRPGRRRICRCRWPRSLPAKWISTASCNRATTSAWSSTRRSAITASSATGHWRRRRCRMPDGRWSPSGSTRRSGQAGYYDGDGKSLKRFFLRSPLKFDPSISSGFSRSRQHPILNIRRAHLGVDYRAPSGAPVVAVSPGTVTMAAWTRGGGRTVKIRHASGYETAYLHLSSFGPGVRAGAHRQSGPADRTRRRHRAGDRAAPALRVEEERRACEPGGRASQAAAGRSVPASRWTSSAVRDAAMASLDDGR